MRGNHRIIAELATIFSRIKFDMNYSSPFVSSFHIFVNIFICISREKIFSIYCGVGKNGLQFFWKYINMKCTYIKQGQQKTADAKFDSGCEKIPDLWDYLTIKILNDI